MDACPSAVQKISGPFPRQGLSYHYTGHKDANHKQRYDAPDTGVKEGVKNVCLLCKSLAEFCGSSDGSSEHTGPATSSPDVATVAIGAARPVAPAGTEAQRLSWAAARAMTAAAALVAARAARCPHATRWRIACASSRRHRMSICRPKSFPWRCARVPPQAAPGLLRTRLRTAQSPTRLSLATTNVNMLL